MDAAVALFGLELLVPDLDRAVALFTGVLQFELHDRGPSTLVAGDMAIVTDGRIAITLLQPSTTGDGNVLTDRTPRLSQLIFGAAGEAFERSMTDAVEAGLSVTPTDSGFFIVPEAIEGALGLDAAVVVVQAESPTIQ